MDIQPGARNYAARHTNHPTLHDLAAAALGTRPAIDEQLAPRTGRHRDGGARPKAILSDDGRPLIAKFSSSTDVFPVVQGEYVAMELAKRAGIVAAPVRLTRAGGRYALLVERFDRGLRLDRRRVVSALTVLGLTTFPEGRYATYSDLAHQIRAQFVHANASLRGCRADLVQHPVWEHRRPRPQPRCVRHRSRSRTHARLRHLSASALRGNGDSGNGLRTRRQSGRPRRTTYRGRRSLPPRRSRRARIVTHQADTIRGNWDDVCDAAELTADQRAAFMGRQFLNPHAFR